jgi:hypothetical protein
MKGVAHHPASATGRERLYGCWRKMHERCKNPNADNYKNYGGRGITVCEEWTSWLTFKAWALANGYGPSLTIERRDGAGNYEPGNCTWATKAEQNRNRRNVALAPDGRLYSEIADESGVGAKVYFNRVSLGWCAKHAATFPNLGKRSGARTRRPCDGASCHG